MRGWAGQPERDARADLAESFGRNRCRTSRPGPTARCATAHLALSGGGANGAFGAGFLNGWSSNGTRPVFKIVTGVSTGALMAPFAFIGPDYDLALQQFYTTTSTRDIFLLSSTFGLLWQLMAGEALADTRPLQAMIAHHVDAELLRRVADAHQRGRRLYIGTTNLDAPRFVVWNMGLIARQRPARRAGAVPQGDAGVGVDPGGLSAGVLRSRARRRAGRATTRCMSTAASAHACSSTAACSDGSVIRERGGQGGVGKEDIFVIHNGQLVPQPDPVPRSLASIAVRVIDASGRAAALGDLFRIYGYAQRREGQLPVDHHPQRT